MRRAKAIGLLSLLIAALTLIACGGSSTLSKSDTIKKAGVICRQATDQAKQYALGRSIPTNPEEIDGAITKDIGIAGQANSALKKLKPGSDGRANFDLFVSAQEQIVKANTDQLAAAKAGDREQFQSSVQDLLSATGNSNKAAKAYGIPGCPYDPVSVQVGRKVLASKNAAGSQTAAGSSGDAVGLWIGRVTQYGPGSNTQSYPVIMIVKGDSPTGAIVGGIRYPSLACGGQLQLSRFQGASYVYREHIISGRKQCADGGTILANVSGNSMSWHWVARGVEVLGVLARRRGA